MVARIGEYKCHGVYVGLLAQELKREFDAETQAELDAFVYDLMRVLYDNECEYTRELYDGVGLSEDVNTFVRYNANKAIQNLGMQPMFEDETPNVNPIVLNGLSTSTKSHDFFSQKGNGYKKAVVMPVHDLDFEFEDGVEYSSFIYPEDMENSA